MAKFLFISAQHSLLLWGCSNSFKLTFKASKSPTTLDMAFQRHIYHFIYSICTSLTIKLSHLMCWCWWCVCVCVVSGQGIWKWGGNWKVMVAAGAGGASHWSTGHWPGWLGLASAAQVAAEYLVPGMDISSGSQVTPGYTGTMVHVHPCRYTYI